MPSATAIRAPSTIGSGPASVPCPSSATGTRVPGAAANLALLLRLSRGGRLGLGEADHLTAGVGAAGGTDAVRQPGAVAARALVQSRASRPVLGAALVAPGARGALLGDGHEGGDGS